MNIAQAALMALGKHYTFDMGTDTFHDMLPVVQRHPKLIWWHHMYAYATYSLPCRSSFVCVSHLLCVWPPQCTYTPLLVCEDAWEGCTKVLVHLDQLLMYSSEPDHISTNTATTASRWALLTNPNVNLGGTKIIPLAIFMHACFAYCRCYSR